MTAIPTEVGKSFATITNHLLKHAVVAMLIGRAKLYYGSEVSRKFIMKEAQEGLQYALKAVHKRTAAALISSC